jgi:hypothetical protein
VIKARFRGTGGQARRLQELLDAGRSVGVDVAAGKRHGHARIGRSHVLGPATSKHGASNTFCCDEATLDYSTVRCRLSA